MLCPFGSDDEDFDVNYILNRNTILSHIMVDDDDLEEIGTASTISEHELPPIQLTYTESGLGEDNKALEESETEAQTRLRRKIRDKIKPNFGHHYFP